jgi:cob(I)alamin adenosyltransferase
MSITTKAGDQGVTALMYNRRVSKGHPRVEAYGSVDELNSAIGLGRATAETESVHQHLLAVQKDLVILMGELATAREDLERYRKDGFAIVVPEMTAKLDHWIHEIEAQRPAFHDWATPGASIHSAFLDLARSVCRRGERHVCALQDEGELNNPEIIVYLNRLSDWLWLAARWVEPKPSSPGTSLV